MRPTFAAAGVAAALVAGACSTTSKSVSVPSTQSVSTPPSSSATATGAIDPANFVSRVDNEYFPLKPGEQRVYTGVKDGKSAHEVFVVTSESKTILGVGCVVVRDTLNLDGHPAEMTDDWYAQDKQGNVWYFGEETATLNPDGTIKSREGRFLAGRDGADAGIYITATLQIGVDYRQEYYKGHAEDHFVVTDLSVPVTVPYGSFQNALRTKEFTPLEPGVVDHKYYVRGVGVVKEGSEDGSERLELVSYMRA
jgi:hypothetical protein